MAFLLRRTDQGGGWVTAPGSHRAYTHKRENAQRYPTREAAERYRCPDNERIEDG